MAANPVLTHTDEEEEEEGDYDLTDKFIAGEEEEDGEEEEGEEGAAKKKKKKRRREALVLEDDDYDLLEENKVTVHTLAASCLPLCRIIGFIQSCIFHRIHRIESVMEVYTVLSRGLFTKHPVVANLARCLSEALYL